MPDEETILVEHLQHQWNQYKKSSFRNLVYLLEEEKILDDRGNWFPTELLEMACDAIQDNIEVNGHKYNPLSDRLVLRAIRPQLSYTKEFKNDAIQPQ